uniref:Uncharacterized protein n=1 Tax=Nelumbo nucifera TaxID=4432 RepID=A0A822Y595_NELNU|nr:TPA_asm: hypothetical protein HUJ06_027854 [Nelumbo nucifera]
MVVELGDFRNLVVFNVCNNSLTGQVDNKICSSSSSIQILDLSAKQFFWWPFGKRICRTAVLIILRSDIFHFLGLGFRMDCEELANPNGILLHRIMRDSKVDSTAGDSCLSLVKSLPDGWGEREGGEMSRLRQERRGEEQNARFT